RVRKGIRIDRLQLLVPGNGGWFAILIPISKLFSPELLRENLLGAFKALRDFGFRSRQHLSVGEAVYVLCLQTIHEQPVEPGEVVGAFVDGGGGRSLPIARHRSREVHRVLLPRAWTRRLKTKSGGDVCRNHGYRLL